MKQARAPCAPSGARPRPVDRPGALAAEARRSQAAARVATPMALQQDLPPHPSPPAPFDSSHLPSPSPPPILFPRPPSTPPPFTLHVLFSLSRRPPFTPPPPLCCLAPLLPRPASLSLPRTPFSLPPRPPFCLPPPPFLVCLWPPFVLLLLLLACPYEGCRSSPPQLLRASTTGANPAAQTAGLPAMRGGAALPPAARRAPAGAKAPRGVA
jgi:hypothetical protein